MKSKSGISSRDVARLAGVSQATVSYILNNVKSVKIKSETREAVLEAVKKLNYHPNEIARGMKLNKSMSIGVVTDRSVTNFYFMKTLEGIRDGILQNNYSITLLFNKIDEISQAEFIRYYNSNRLDGIVFAFSSIDDNAIKYMNESGIPFVTIDVIPLGRSNHEIYTDYLEHIEGVVEYYKAKGIRRIGYAGPESGTGADMRLETFKASMKRLGMDFDESLVALSVFDDNKISAALVQLFDSRNCPEAIIAGSPRFGLLAVKNASRLGIRVPEELHIIALGSSNYYSVVHPELSAVEVPLYDMGFNAARMLIDIMSGVNIEKSVVLPSEFIHRNSS